MKWTSIRNLLAVLVMAGALAACSKHDPAASRDAESDALAENIRPPHEVVEVKDPELVRLEAALEGDSSTAGMKEAARNLADYWDRRLVRAERQHEQKLDPKGIALFRVAERAWRHHRAAEVEVEADTCRGGSMASLVGTQLYADMTASRARAIESDERDHPNER